MIFEPISNEIPPQMKILNMVIPFQCASAVLSQIGALQAPRHPTKCDLINYVKLFPTVANSWRYPIGRCVTKASASEFQIFAADHTSRFNLIGHFRFHYVRPRQFYYYNGQYLWVYLLSLGIPIMFLFVDHTLCSCHRVINSY